MSDERTFTSMVIWMKRHVTRSEDEQDIQNKSSKIMDIPGSTAVSLLIPLCGMKISVAPLRENCPFFLYISKNMFHNVLIGP